MSMITVEGTKCPKCEKYNLVQKFLVTPIEKGTSKIRMSSEKCSCGHKGGKQY